MKIFTAFIVIAITGCNNTGYKHSIGSRSGNYWDLIYSESSYIKHKVNGYCFRADGKFYSYHYFGEGRTPFNDVLFDASTEPTIEANLRNWSIISDSILIIDQEQFTIDYLRNDTLSLKTGKLNPVIKLLRVSE